MKNFPFLFCKEFSRTNKRVMKVIKTVILHLLNIVFYFIQWMWWFVWSYFSNGLYFWNIPILDATYYPFRTLLNWGCYSFVWDDNISVCERDCLVLFPFLHRESLSDCNQIVTCSWSNIRITSSFLFSGRV